MLPKHLSVKYDSKQYLWWLGNTQSNGKSKEYKALDVVTHILIQ